MLKLALVLMPGEDSMIPMVPELYEKTEEALKAYLDREIAVVLK